MNSQKNTKRSESNNTKSTFYITTAIDYATGTPHIGHAYEKIATDVIARSKRLEGKDVFFLTGTDEHGQKVFEKAQENNKKVQDFVDEQTQKFIDLTKTLNLSNDFFIRTTDLQHKQFVQLMLQKAYDNGDIYLDEYEGLYCVGCEKYYGEDELIEIDGTPHMCPIHKTQCRSVKQQNYFFRLSKYQDFLLELYEKNPKFISPSSRREEIINRVKGGLRDLSISRPKETLTWGIEFPFDTTHVTYVWFDALFNYLSATKYKELSTFEGHWPADIHVIGADISWFHMVYWPAFLKSCGFELPNTVHAHGMILDKDGHKMSKSLGNVVDPIDEIKKYGLDEFRYYSMSLGSFGDDCRYSHAEFEQTIINDLNNDLGNLVSRVHTMVQKYVGGTLRTLDENTLEEVDIKVFNLLDIKEEYMSLIDSFEIHKAIQLVWSRIRDLNAYINQTEPFKVEDEKRREVIMQVLVNSLYNLTSFISIVMPQKSQLLAQQLGFEVKEDLEFSCLDKEIKLGEKVQLFENLSKKKDEKTHENNNSQNKDEKQKSLLTILDESRVEIKAILFDFDGVLVDNYKTVYDANNLAYNLSEEKFKDLFDGNPITGFKEAFEESKVKDFYEYLDEATKEMKVEKKIKKELAELQKKYSLFCITSNLKKNIELVLQNSELENSVFEEILCGDFNFCKEQKINHILEKYNLQKEEVVFVTDTLGDVKEANRAGVKTIAVDFGFHEQERLEKGAPYTIVSSFKQIRRAVDALEKQTISNITIQLSDNLNLKTLSARLHTLHPTQKNTKLALFVHGFCASKFGCKSEEFKWQFIGEGYDFLSFDFLGCGDNEVYPISIDSQLKQVEELLEIITKNLGYTEVVLIGHSMGGYNVLAQKHSVITKKIAIAPLCFSRTKEQVMQHTLSRGIRNENASNIKAVFFDFDGVLVDTFSISYETMKLFHSNLTQDEYKEWFTAHIAKSWESKFSSMEDKIKFDDLYTQRNESIELSLTVKETCEKLKKKYDLFCVTSNLKRNIDSILRRSGEEDLFKEILCYHFELSKSKKMQYLLEKYNLQKEEVVFVTDTLGDLEEANEIGIKTICLDTGYNSKKTLQKGKPFAIVSDFAHIERQIESLERKIQQSKPIEFVDDDEKIHLLDPKLITDFTQISTKKLQKIANTGQFQTLVLQAQKDPVILKKDVDVFVEGCDTSNVLYSTVEGGTHSFKLNTQEENEFFFKEMRNFIKYGIPVKPPSFTDLCLQVGTIISVENHPDADALYVEQVDFGESGVRQIVSGLKKYFTKEEMVGKQVLAVTNLQTAKLRGVDSQGMLLLAENEEGKLSFIEPEEKVENGSYVSLNIEDEAQVANNSNIITVDEFFKHSLQAVEGGVVYGKLEENNTLKIQTSQGFVKLISSKQVYGTIR